MRTVDPIAPGVTALAEAGGITMLESSAKCEACGEWNDGSPAELARWRRWHAREAHDAMRPSVLGLDLSLTRAGIAVTTLDPKLGKFCPSLLTHIGEAGSENATWDDRCDRLVRQVKAVVGIVDAARRAGADIRLALIEGPAYAMARMPSYYDRAGLQWSVYAALRSRGIPIAVPTPDHRALFICGVTPPSGDAGKALVLSETRARWSTPRTADIMPDPSRFIANHDQADALGLAELGVVGAKFKGLAGVHPVPWQVRNRHVSNAHRVTFPEVTL